MSDQIETVLSDIAVTPAQIELVEARKRRVEEKLERVNALSRSYLEAVSTLERERDSCEDETKVPLLQEMIHRIWERARRECNTDELEGKIQSINETLTRMQAELVLVTKIRYGSLHPSEA